MGTLYFINNVPVETGGEVDLPSLRAAKAKEVAAPRASGAPRPVGEVVGLRAEAARNRAPFTARTIAGRMQKGWPGQEY